MATDDKKNSGEVLPPSPTEEVIMRWVRAWMTVDGVKEERVQKLQRVADLERAVHERWWDKEIAERQQAMLVRQARRKFDDETAEELAALLQGVLDPKRLDRVAELIIDCAHGPELLAQLKA